MNQTSSPSDEKATRIDCSHLNTSSLSVSAGATLETGFVANAQSIAEGGTLEHEVLRLYFQYFHTACPIIDETKFMGYYYNHRYFNETLSPKVSLLCQAIMFVAFPVSFFKRFSHPISCIFPKFEPVRQRYTAKP
jgi:hypothetical protein